MSETPSHNTTISTDEENLDALAPPPQPERARLPEVRHSITHKFNIDGHEGYIIVGMYDDGRPGEVFLKMAKQGSTVRGLMDAIGVLTSLALQHGVTVEELADKFDYARFEPCGWTRSGDIGYARSIVDYVFRWLGSQFSEAYRASHPPLSSVEDVPPVSLESDETE